MKEKKTNSVTSFQPESITDAVSVEFSRVTDSNGTTANGSLTKGGMTAGDISYDSKADFLILRLKPYSCLTEGEVSSVCASVPGFIKELLS